MAELWFVLQLLILYVAFLLGFELAAYWRACRRMGNLEGPRLSDLKITTPRLNRMTSHQYRTRSIKKCPQ